LDLDDDAEHGLALHQKHHQVGTVLSGHDVGEVRRLEPHLRIVRKLDMQRFSQELGRQRRAIAEQQEQHLVQLRRHPETPAKSWRNSFL